MGVSRIFVLLFAVFATVGGGRAGAQYKWHDTFSCRHTGLSGQFDIELGIEHYVDAAIPEGYGLRDSLGVTLSVTEKKSGRRIDLIEMSPCSLGKWAWRDVDYRGNATSYSTGFNVGRKTFDNYLGTIIVADLNFDGRDDIAAVEDSGVSSGPYYAFFMRDDAGGFVRDDFLGEEMMYFPFRIDPSLRRLTTLSPANTYEVCRTVFELSRDTCEWKMVVREILGDKGAGV